MAEGVPIKLSRSFEGEKKEKEDSLRCAHRRSWGPHGSALPGGSTVDVTELVMGRAKDSAFNKPSPRSLSVAGLETERKV